MNLKTTLAVIAIAVVTAFGIGMVRGYVSGGRSVATKIEKKGAKDVAKAETARARVEREPVGVCVRDPLCRRAD